MKRGKLIIFEGIDGSGTTTQTSLFHNYLKSISKYHDVLTTHEPWRSDEIKRMLETSETPLSDGKLMMELYIQDRANHCRQLIAPNLDARVFVISDRYHMSTFAYQGTQGIPFVEIEKAHLPEIITPDITFFLDVNYETARQRIEKRGEGLEKFERDEKFTRMLIDKYRELANSQKSILGKVVKINGGRSIEEVAGQIEKACNNGFRI